MAKREKFVASKNNDNYLVDRSHDDEKEKYDYKRVKDNPGTLRFGRVLIKESAFKDLAFINFADLHFFGDGFDLQRAELALNFAEHVANAHVILGGDIFDLGTKTSKTNVHMNQLNNQDALDLSSRFLEKIASKTVVAVGGNHDGIQGDRNKDNGISPLKLVMQKFGIPYFDYNALITVKIGKHYYNLLTTHAGSGQNPLDGGAKLAEQFIARNNIPVDALFLGHNHYDASMSKVYQFKNYDAQGKLHIVEGRRLHVFIEPSMQGDNQHYATRNIDTGNTNTMVTVLREIKNPNYSKDNKYNEQEYMLDVIRFPILNENSNSYSEPALQYLRQLGIDKKQLNEEVKAIIEKNKVDAEIKNCVDIITKQVNGNKRGGK